MIEVIAILVAVGLGVTLFAIADDKRFKLQEKINDGYNPFALDGDDDGLVQEGTKWERPVKKAAKKPAKKAVKKAVKKTAAPKPKKKAVKKKAAKKRAK